MLASTLPLEKMSVEEKLRAMELLWDDLCRQAGGVSSPDWHEDVLAQRQAAVERGEDQFEDWEAAKRSIVAEDDARKAKPKRSIGFLD